MKHSHKNSAYMRARHRRLEALGLCTHCGKVPSRTNRKTCAECGKVSSIKSAKRVKRIRPAVMALGLCGTCLKREAMPGRHWCAVCSEGNTERAAKLRAKRKAEGRCPRCGKPAVDGRVMCSVCCKARKPNLTQAA
ncbi:MAG TPA: hypothetical protein VK150_08975 [Geothrix sp.]|nr:hypothetical protein [Geothrix sp.]